MMTLTEAARFFDDQVFTDPHGVAQPFNGKLLPFNESTRSGPATQRRILDTSPNSVIPTERELVSDSVRLVVGFPNYDWSLGEIIRVKYPVLPVQNTFNIRTVGEVLSGTGGFIGVFGTEMFIRRAIFEDQSHYDGGYHLYTSSYYSAKAGYIADDGTKWFVLREDSRTDEAGFGSVEITQLDDPIQTLDITIYDDNYDTNTSEYGSTSYADVSCFVEHYSLNFQNEALGFTGIEAGDKAISILKSVVPSIRSGDKVGKFIVKGVKDRGDIWVIHGRENF